jgi:hypothetical protein
VLEFGIEIEFLIFVWPSVSKSESQPNRPTTMVAMNDIAEGSEVSECRIQCKGNGLILPLHGLCKQTKNCQH